MNRLRHFLLRLLGLPKTIYFNFHYLPFSQAIKFPIYIAHNVVLLRTGGKIIINGPVKKDMIRIGFRETQLYDIASIRSLWQVEGTVIFNGTALIGPGTRISVEKDATLEIGRAFKVTADTAIACFKSISFGDEVVIAWEVQFLDGDWHHVLDEQGNKINPNAPITVGNNVWVGSRVTVLKGATIPDGSIVSAGAVVNKPFEEKAIMLAGVPARIVKHDVRWAR